MKAKLVCLLLGLGLIVGPFLVPIDTPTNLFDALSITEWMMAAIVLGIILCVFGIPTSKKPH